MKAFTRSFPFLFAGALLLAGCTHTQTRTGSAPNGADSMNNEDQKPRTIDIHGRLVLESPLAVLPGAVRVQLIRNGVVMAETTSTGGLFHFEGNYPAGTYLVRGRTNGFAGEVSVDLGGETSKDVRLLLEKKKGTEG